MTLTNNFKRSINFPTKATLDNCIKIADEYAIEFSGWCLNSLLDGEEPKGESIEELLEIYKKEKKL